MEDKKFHVYIMATGRNGTFYVGVTSDLVKRVGEHKTGQKGGFTDKYGVKTLVYFEACSDAETAIKREKRVKKWSRASKMRQIETLNPEWVDLYEQICG